jgi:hypothetical protein
MSISPMVIDSFGDHFKWFQWLRSVLFPSQVAVGDDSRVPFFGMSSQRSEHCWVNQFCAADGSCPITSQPGLEGQVSFPPVVSVLPKGCASLHNSRAIAMKEVPGVSVAELIGWNSNQIY